MKQPRPHRLLLRTALLVLLTLGVMISPVLAMVGELHAIEHAALADSDSLHHHLHSAAADHPDHHGGDPDSDPDHATGMHGLMHQSVSISVTLPNTALDIPGQSACAPRLPELARADPPRKAPSSPFRPPIA
jgi:hypothetical protein